MFEMVGVRVYGDCNLNWYSHLGNFMIAYYISMVTHTIYYWGMKGQFFFGLRCLCGMGIMISVNSFIPNFKWKDFEPFLLSPEFSPNSHLFRLLSLSAQSVPLYYKAIGKDRFKFKSLLNFAGDYMYSEVRSTSRFSMVCEEGARKMWKSYAILTCIICTSMSLVSVGPIFLFFRTGIWITPLGTQFPLADHSDIAFYMDLVIQMAIALIGILVTVSIEMSQVIVNNAVQMAADVTKLSIDELREQLSEEGEMRLKTRTKFRNLMLQVQDFDR